MSKVALRSILSFATVFFCSIYLTGCVATGGKNAALQVTSNPQASIFLDGKHLGKTPFYSDQLKEGVASLKITAGEASYVEQIELRGGALTVVSRDLNNNALAQSGEVLWLAEGSRDFFIATVPPNAQINVDGSQKGKTPLLIRDLEPGDHKIKLQLQGYADREFSVKTSDSYKLVANATLASKTAKNPKESSPDSTEKVEILTTPQGFLRVRKEPDLASQEVGQVSPGSSYEIIQETDTWVKISFDGKLGWISKQYTKRV